MDALIWFVCAAGLLWLETLCPAGVFIFMSCGCLAASLAGLLDAPMAFQLVLAGFVAGVSAVLFRKKMRQIFSGKKASSQERKFWLANAEGKAVDALVPGREGNVSVGGSYWRARLADGAEPVEKGARIVVVSTAPGDSQLLLVKAAEKGSDSITNEEC